MPPKIGETAPDFSALLCDGEVFREERVSSVAGSNGIVLVFYGFSFSAIAVNWWKRYHRHKWHTLNGRPVVGISRDGPYSQNEFIRKINSPFRLFSDIPGHGIDAYDLGIPRGGMGKTVTANRAVFILTDELVVEDRWVADTWTEPVPIYDLEANLTLE